MHKAAFTPDNAAMLLIDHQIGTMAWTHSHDINLVKQNALKPAQIAKAAGLSTVLTSSMEDRIQGPLVPEFKEILPDEFAARIKRPGIVNAMHHEGFNKAVKATGRKKLFVAGITTEICVTFPVLQMLDEGYEVQVSADASASYTKYGDDIALRLGPDRCGEGHYGHKVGRSDRAFGAHDPQVARAPALTVQTNLTTRLSRSRPVRSARTAIGRCADRCLFATLDGGHAIVGENSKS
jgi:nicotinamidase-related amidase